MNLRISLTPKGQRSKIKSIIVNVIWYCWVCLNILNLNYHKKIAFSRTLTFSTNLGFLSFRVASCNEIYLDKELTWTVVCICWIKAVAEAGVDRVSTAFQPSGPSALPPHQQAATRSDLYTPLPLALSSILSSPDQGLDSPYKGFYY